MAKLLRPKYLFLVSLALAWLFDFLFWKKPWGVSFPIFTLALVAAGFWFASSQNRRVPRNSLWLLIPIFFFSLVSVFRTEPFTLFFTRSFTLLAISILALTFLGGRWVEYGFSDFLTKLIGFIPRGLLLFGQAAPARSGSKNAGGSRSAAPFLRGLLIALPLLWFFSVLLSSADPIFEQWMRDLFTFIDFDKAPEYAFRLFYIGIFAVIFAAVYMFALFKTGKDELPAKKTPFIDPILGIGEALTVLASLNILFAVFVIVQFQYFFGGVNNVLNTDLGLTYAEYARQGFLQLVFVAALSLVLFMALSSITSRKVNQQKWFSWLGIALFALVAVILASAFQRLLLYEAAYGFTRIRTIVHVFMIWLGLLLLAVVLLELFHRRHKFALVTLLAAFGFVATLPLLNVDAFIARANIEHRFRGGGGGEILDTDYLGGLSTDAMPALVEAYNQTKNEVDPSYMNGIAHALACNAQMHSDFEERHAWQSWNVSYSQASDLWSSVSVNAVFPYVYRESCNWFSD